MSDQRSNNFFKLIQFSCFLVFAGRAWQHLIWDAPFRAFFWDQALLEGMVTSLTGMEWFDYVTNPATDGFIQGLTRGMGVFYLGMAILTLLLKPTMKRVGWLYFVSSGLLAILALLYCKEKFYHAAQFFEYAIQFLSPIFFYLTIFQKIDWSHLLLLLKGAIAMTFVAHGLYAFGFYPRPGVFVDMTINILHCSEPFAHDFLWVAGVLDFVIGVGIFLPKVDRACLIYAVIWGLATAVARTWANLQFDASFWALLNQYLPQTIYRLPHGTIPMAAFVLTAYISATSTSSEPQTVTAKPQHS
ncbi:hypothetical protein [Pontibacter sp. G13]|uniref:hypothetical protein n=1 Tax=Pontibacter sp. G13 TaxID=3074898 RepID=UPI00288AEE58|nr:hypothetical protein [Pontibacter sp. G13]WNJ20201.1 hypothetical protein RJD25_06950 [Pontibacter sp. G13]